MDEEKNCAICFFMKVKKGIAKCIRGHIKKVNSQEDRTFNLGSNSQLARSLGYKPWRIAKYCDDFNHMDIKGCKFNIPEESYEV